MNSIHDLLFLAAVVTFIITGILLIFANSLELRDGVGLVAFGLAALSASVWPGWVRRP